MRRVGQMDRVVTIQRVTATTIDGFGEPVQTWTDLVTLRAKKLGGVATDETRTDIAVTDTVVKLQTYYYDGLTLEDRATYESGTYTLKSISEIGRRRGLEIHIDKLGQ
jgi:head-tail adaptor